MSIESATFIGNGPGKVNVTHKRGCIYTFNGRLDIIGPVIISGNSVGGIHAVQSQIHINSSEDTVISNNTASLGGGIMLRESDLVIRSPCYYIRKYEAQLFGGGIYAYQSIIDVTSEGKN